MFACKICNYTTDIKCNYKKHLLTNKHVMKKLLNEDTINTQKYKNEPKMSQNEPKMSQKRAKNEPKKMSNLSARIVTKYSVQNQI